jgi:hypothetical protein
VNVVSIRRIGADALDTEQVAQVLLELLTMAGKVVV